MGASFLITLREGFEAALIVAIVLAYLRQIDRRDTFRYVWLGTAAALAVAAAIGVVAWVVLGGLTGDLQRLVFGVISLAAVGVLTWMVFWMKRQARFVSRELREQINRTLEHGGSPLAIAAIPFVAVLREGVETVLYLLAVLAGTSPRDFATGSVLGIAGAVVLGALVYQGGRRLNLRLFFSFSGGMIVLIAAGLFARGVAWLQEAGVAPTVWWPVWDVQHNPIVGHGTFAQFLSGMLGWNPRPSIEEVVAWAAYFVIVGWAFSEWRVPFLRPAQHSAPSPLPRQ